MYFCNILGKDDHPTIAPDFYCFILGLSMQGIMTSNILENSNSRDKLKLKIIHCRLFLQ